MPYADLVQWIILIDTPLFAVACVAAVFCVGAAAADRSHAAKQAIVYRAFTISKRVE